jgi:plastocyanin
MSLITSKTGFPVAAGQRLKLTVNYDDELPHTRVMGIMGFYIAPDPTVKDGCGPLPTDVQVQGAGRPGRTTAPRVRVPINAINPDGIAGPIANLPGPAVQLGSGDSIDVADSSFQPSKIVVRPGSVLRWSFLGPDLHTVTVANGPRGFASPNLSDGRTFEHQFTRPGTYQLFCSLHPTLMSETVRVLAPHKRRRHRRSR